MRAKFENPGKQRVAPKTPREMQLYLQALDGGRKPVWWLLIRIWFQRLFRGFMGRNG